MSNIIFAQPRHVYESYADLRSLIALSDFPLVYYDEIDPQSDNTYVLTVLNGECEAGWQDPRARIVVWDMEYRREPLKPIPGVSDVWHMDKAQAEFIGAKYAPVGGHPGLRLTDNAPAEPLYDVAYYGYLIPRRQRIQQELRERGLRLSPQAAWGAERDAMLNASRTYGHIHQWDDIPAVPGLRMVVAAAYHLPVMTETCADMGIFADLLYHWNYADYAKYVSVAQSDSELQHFGWALHNLLCERLTFRKSVENAL